MTVTVGDDVADDTGLPSIEDLIKRDLGKAFVISNEFDAAKDFDPGVMLPGWDAGLILAACTHYAKSGCGAGVEERWLMGTPTRFVCDTPKDDQGTYRKRAYGLWRFLHIQRALALRTRLEQSVDWDNGLMGLTESNRALVEADCNTYAPAYITALKVMEQIIGRYALTREDLDARRRKVIGHPEWPAAKYMGLGNTVIEILEAGIPEIIGADYFRDLEAAIAKAIEKLQSIGQTSGQYSGQPPARKRPGTRSRSAARRRAEERGPRPNPNDRSGRRGGPRRGLTIVEASFLGATAAARGPYTLGPRAAWRILLPALLLKRIEP
jgi:hypothetical protein